MTLKIDVRGLDEVIATLEGLGKTRAVGIVTEAAADEIVTLLHEQPDETPYHYVSRAKAYPGAPAGPGWFSAKQRRYVMARLRSGDMRVPYQRTGNTSRAWKRIGRLSKSKVVNESDAAPFVFSDTQQSNHEKLAGWETTGRYIDRKSNQIFDAAYAALEKWISTRKK